MQPRITWPFLLITAIFLLLSAAAWPALPQPTIDLALSLGAGWLLWLWAGWQAWRKPHGPWLGTVLFALSWVVFPLLKIINSHWLSWSADAWLTAIDSRLWGGQILPAYFHYEQRPLAADVLAGAYFCFYFIVLGAVVLYAVRRRQPAATAFFNGLLCLYLLGFIGYFALPAAGPAFYSLPDQGASGPIARHVIAVVKNGVTGMDVFPSLHTAITLYINIFLWRDGHRRTALALLPISVGIVLATIYLRYHYGVDVLVGLLLAAWAGWRFTPQPRQHPH